MTALGKSSGSGFAEMYYRFRSYRNPYEDVLDIVRSVPVTMH